MKVSEPCPGRGTGRGSEARSPYMVEPYAVYGRARCSIWYSHLQCMVEPCTVYGRAKYSIWQSSAIYSEVGFTSQYMAAASGHKGTVIVLLEADAGPDRHTP